MEKEFQTSLTPEFLIEVLKEGEYFQGKTITRAELKHLGAGEDLQQGSYILKASVFYVPSSQQEQELQLFVKVLNADHKHLEKILSCFEKECNMYTDMIPRLENFNKLKESGVVMGDFLPKFFWAGDCGEDKVIILEDLHVQGFSSSCRKNFHDLPKATIVLESIAKLHATSYVMKKLAQEKEGCEEEILKSVQGFEGVIENFPYLVDSWSTEKGVSFLMPLFGASLKNTVNLLEVVDQLFHSEEFSGKIKLEKTFNSPDVIGKLKKMEEEQSLYHHVISKLLQPIEPFSVVTHGDLHMYNIWFKDAKDSSSPDSDPSSSLKTKLFDFQMVRYGSPLLDVQQYLVQSTTPQFRKLHLQDCLACYSASFTSTCQLLGLPQKDIFFDDIKNVQDEFRRTYPYGFLFPLYFVINRYTSQQAMNSVFQASTDGLTKEESARQRMLGVLDLIQKSGDDIWTGFEFLFGLMDEAEVYDTLDLLC